MLKRPLINASSLPGSLFNSAALRSFHYHILAIPLWMRFDSAALR